MKDYSLYEKVNSILSSKTNKLAENILFGRDGIHINSNNYYQELITSFNMKKESIIPKVNNKIIFDIDNKEEIWNIIFLGKILQEKAVNFNNEEFNEAVKDVMLLNTPVKPVDENALEELRKSIRVIQKFKDSTMHNQNNDSYKFIDTEEECKIVINNNGGKFPLEVSIPIRYIEGFNKGTIIPLREDKDIEYKTNDIAYPLLEALDYDPKKLANFFYRVEPEILSLLLDKCDNDVKKLYQLPTVFFSHLRWFKANIKSAIKKYDFETLKNMPYSAGSSRDFWRILDKYGKDILYLPNYFFHRSDTLEKLIDKYGIELVKTLPEDAIYDFDSTVKIIEENKDKTNDIKNINFITEDEINKIKENINSIEKKYKNKYKVLNEKISLNDCMNFIYENYKFDGKYIPLKDDKNAIWWDTNVFDFRLKDEYETYYNFNKLLEKYDISLLKKLPSHHAFDNYEDTIKFLDKYGEDVQFIPKDAFGKYCDFEFFESLVNDYNLDYRKIVLTDYLEYHSRKLYEEVMNKDNMKDMLYNFKGKTAEFKKDNLDKLLKIVDYDYSRLNEFPSELFECDTTILDELLKRYESNVMRSIFGINNPKVISLLIYMRSVFDKYDSKELSKDNKFINDLSSVDTKIIKDDNEYKELINEDIIKYDDKFKHVVNNYYWKDNNEKINYINKINEYSYINYQNNIKHDLGIKLNNELIRHLRNSVSHFRFKVIDDETIKLYDENENGNVVFDKNYNIYELLNFVHDIEKCLNNDIEEKELIEICSNMGLDKYNKVVISELLHIMSINKELNLNNEKEKSVKM